MEQKMNSAIKILKQLPSGIELLNDAHCRYYFFNTDDKGNLTDGLFWTKSNLDDTVFDGQYDYVLDISKKMVYVVNPQQATTEKLYQLLPSVKELLADFPTDKIDFSPLTSMIITVGLDKQSDWKNGIFENSRYYKFHISCFKVVQLLKWKFVIENFACGGGCKKIRKKSMYGEKDFLNGFSQILESLKTKTKIAGKEIYKGKVYVKNKTDDFFITEDKMLGKFIWGVKTTDMPYVRFIKEISVDIPKGNDVTFEFNNNTWNDLPGEVALFEIEGEKNIYLWEY